MDVNPGAAHCTRGKGGQQCTGMANGHVLAVAGSRPCLWIANAPLPKLCPRPPAGPRRQQRPCCSGTLQSTKLGAWHRPALKACLGGDARLLPTTVVWRISVVRVLQGCACRRCHRHPSSPDDSISGTAVVLNGGAGGGDEDGGGAAYH